MIQKVLILLAVVFNGNMQQHNTDLITKSRRLTAVIISLAERTLETVQRYNTDLVTPSHRPGAINNIVNTTTKQISYDRECLLQIKESIIHRKAYNMLPIPAVNKIRSLKIYKRRKRGKRGGCRQQKQHKILAEYEKSRTVNQDNLISINTIKDRHVTNNAQNLKIGLVNARSIRNKDIRLKQDLIEEDIDACVVTETWLDDSNKVWIENTELNKDGLKMQNSCRNDGRKGGGIAIVYKDIYNIKQEEEKRLRTFHSVKWKLTMKNTYVNIIGLYRPPPSKSHATTINQFTDEFLENLQEDIINGDHLIILGDFNINIDDNTDADA